MSVVLSFGGCVQLASNLLMTKSKFYRQWAGLQGKGFSTVAQMGNVGEVGSRFRCPQVGTGL